CCATDWWPWLPMLYSEVPPWLRTASWPDSQSQHSASWVKPDTSCTDGSAAVTDPLDFSNSPEHERRIVFYTLSQPISRRNRNAHSVRIGRASCSGRRKKQVFV